MTDFAKDNWGEYKDAVVSDGEAFVDKAKDDIKRWGKLVANGELTKDDLEWLIKGKKDLFEMEKLKQKGLLKSKLDELGNGILDVVVSVALETFT